MSVLSMSQALAHGEVTAVSLVEEALGRASHAQTRWRPFSCIAADAARLAAGESDARRKEGRPGPLEGIPFAIKDLIDTAGIETAYGSRAYQGHVPARDAVVARKLLDAGAILIGNCTTHEFAGGVTTQSSVYGDTGNPAAPGHTPGGSSGGDAAFVAAGVVAAGLGTDTGGSVRIPAAMCGVTGFKPSFGCWSVEGIFPLAGSLDHPGIVGAQVADVASFASVLGLPPDRGIDLQPPRVAVLEHLPDVPVAAPIAARFRSAVDCLERSTLCSELRPETADLFEGCFDIFATIVLVEGGKHHFACNDMATINALYEPETQARLEMARSQNLASYAEAQDARRSFARQLEDWMQGVDFLMLPTCPCLPPLAGQQEVSIDGWNGTIRAALMAYTAPFNLAGLPAISLPLPRAEAELPVGLQLVARRGDDQRLLRFAEQVEAILNG